MKNRIATLRKERGLTLAAVAAGAGTTKAQVQKLERGDRRLSLEWMDRLARAMNVKVSDLLPVEEVACQHNSIETELLKIVRQLSEAEQVALVQTAKGLMGTLRCIEGGTDAPTRTLRRAGVKSR